MKIGPKHPDMNVSRPNAEKARMQRRMQIEAAKRPNAQNARLQRRQQMKEAKRAKKEEEQSLKQEKKSTYDILHSMVKEEEVLNRPHAQRVKNEPLAIFNMLEKQNEHNTVYVAQTERKIAEELHILNDTLKKFSASLDSIKTSNSAKQEQITSLKKGVVAWQKEINDARQDIVNYGASEARKSCEQLKEKINNSIGKADRLMNGTQLSKLYNHAAQQAANPPRQHQAKVNNISATIISAPRPKK